MLDKIEKKEIYTNEHGFIGQAQNDHIIINMWSSSIQITDLTPTTIKPRIKRFNQTTIYTHSNDEALNQAKNQVKKIITENKNVSYQELIKNIFAPNLNIDHRELKKSELPVFRMDFENKNIKISIGDDGLTVWDRDMEGQTFYLSCSKTEKKQIVKEYLKEFDFKETTTRHEIQDFIDNKHKYAVHTFCNID